MDWNSGFSGHDLLGVLFMSGEAQAVEQCLVTDETVTDNHAGLLWQKATASPMNWDAAMIYTANLSLGGKTGWRLPTKMN